MSQLSDRLSLPCGAVLPNRLFKSAMTEGLAEPVGTPTTRHDTLYRRWSAGGAGLLITGNVMVDRRYLERAGNVCVEDDRDLESLRRWAQAGTEGGNHLWAQISHPGRQCTRMSNRYPVAPSAVQLRLGGLFRRPRALRAEELPAIIQRYATTAAVLQQAGFTGVQVHGAHGYLLSQFLSPVTNVRTDAWGGPLEARARLLLEVVGAVREAVGPKFPVAVKLNSADFQKGGFTLEESARVAGWLAEAGIDLIEISGGTYEQIRFFDVKGDETQFEAPKAESSRKREAFFLEYAATIREACKGVPLAVTGGFRSRAIIEEVLGTDELDAVGLARPMCVLPDLPRQFLEGTLDQAPSYEHALKLGSGYFGPGTRNKTLRGLNHQAQVAWFYRQIVALADGREPNLNLTARRALSAHTREEFRIARVRSKALGSELGPS